MNKLTTGRLTPSTPLLNVGQALIQVSFQYIKDTETPEVTYEVFDMLHISILDQDNNILYTEAPLESTTWSYPSSA